MCHADNRKYAPWREAPPPVSTRELIASAALGILALPFFIVFFAVKGILKYARK